MPAKPLKPCSKIGCHELTREKYCATHSGEHHSYDQYRGNSAARGYDARWRKARRAFLERNPLCVECQREGRISAATVVDHIEPHKGDRQKFWDETNWQGLCQLHHNIKTASEDGGFGNQ